MVFFCVSSTCFTMSNFRIPNGVSTDSNVFSTLILKEILVVNSVKISVFLFFNN